MTVLLLRAATSYCEDCVGYLYFLSNYNVYANKFYFYFIALTYLMIKSSVCEEVGSKTTKNIKIIT